MWDAVTAALNTRAANEASGQTLLPLRSETDASYFDQLLYYRTQERRNLCCSKHECKRSTLIVQISEIRDSTAAPLFV